ncbi:aldehyde dehydrogenase family protein [Rhizobium sp. 6AS6]|uniref:Aldehyde dehydrogenase family protein n=1 Tax=Rhizobium aouanii TaxID=3118145 RepID=A0ABU8CW19_9HYPH|nr:aldehyde dehydrogenase family protein [Rhizobium acaciae]MCW1754910.1 aldehyde dehydrogenase family protein [Rhizobium acaciae]
MAKIDAHVDDAVGKGAATRCGGRPRRQFQNLLRADRDHECRQQSYGLPGRNLRAVGAITLFDDPDQVVREATDTIYGLAAYFYASNLKRVWKVAEALEYGNGRD